MTRITYRQEGEPREIHLSLQEGTPIPAVGDEVHVSSASHFFLDGVVARRQFSVSEGSGGEVQTSVTIYLYHLP